MDSERNNLSLLLESLCRTNVDFIVVGGLAAVAQGAPVTTFDVDIVPDLKDENMQSLLNFLDGINTRFRGRPDGQVLKPSFDDLKAGGHCLLMTDLGPIDVLGRIEDDLDYEKLLRDSVETSIHGLKVKVLSLEKIVSLKKASGRKKDQLQLPVLEETLKRLQNS